MSIKDTAEWFAKVAPTPTEQQQKIQLSVHIEEFIEMLDEIELPYNPAIISVSKQILGVLVASLRHNDQCVPIIKDRKAFFDAMLDQIVTATGTSIVNGMDVVGGLDEVNRSNYSKFVNNEPVYNSFGKVMKGPNYTQPELDKFIGANPAIK